jgi:hypothetical protein
MELQEFKAKKLAYEELLKVTTMPVRQANAEDVNSHNFATNIMVPGPVSLTALLISYLIKNGDAILEEVKNMALEQLTADKAQLIKDVESDLSTIKSEIL